VRVLAENLVSRPTSRKQLHDPLDAEARALDHRLADKNGRIRDDALAPVHGLTMPQA